MAELSRYEKEMLVQKTIPKKAKLNMKLLLEPENSKKILREHFSEEKDNPFVAEYGFSRYGTQPISIDKKEGVKIAMELAEKGELLVPFITSRAELIKKEASLIFLIPEDERTDEEKIAAVQKVPHYISSSAFGSVSFEVKKAYAKTRDYSWSSDKTFFDDCTDEQILELLDIGPSLIKNLKKERFTKEILYFYLERMVKGNFSPHFNSADVPEELKDKVFWRSLCMVDGHYYGRIPEEKRDEVITQKLIDYTLEKSGVYVGFLSMADSLPEKFQTVENYIKLMERHSYVGGKLPKHLQNDEFYKEALKTCPQFIEHIDFNTASPEVLAEAFSKCRQVLFCDKKIPQSKWTEELALAIAKCYNEFKYIPAKWQTRAVAEEFVRYHSDLSQLPQKFMDEDMYWWALGCNKYALNHIPDSFKTEEFWKTCKEENILSFRQIPTEYLDEAYVLQEIETGNIIDVNYIPESLRTEKVLLAFAKHQTRNRTIPKEYQTAENVEVLRNNWNFETNYAEAYFWSTIRENLRDEAALDRLATLVERSIEILTTKKQIEANLSVWPQNVIFAPEWYLNEYVRKETAVETEEEKPGARRVKTEIPEIDESTFMQMSIWDILTA